MDDTGILTFGTFRGKTVDWLYDHEKSYFDWVISNCKNQKELVKQMKILIKIKSKGII